MLWIRASLIGLCFVGLGCGSASDRDVNVRQNEDVASDSEDPSDTDNETTASGLPTCAEVDPRGSQVVDVDRLGSVWRPQMATYYEGTGVATASEYSYFTITLTDGEFEGEEFRVGTTDSTGTPGLSAEESMAIPGLSDGDSVLVEATVPPRLGYGIIDPYYTVVRDQDGVPILATYAGESEGAGLAGLRDGWPFEVELRDYCQFTPALRCPTEQLGIRYQLALGDPPVELVEGETKRFTQAGREYVVAVSYAERVEADLEDCDDGRYPDHVNFSVIRAQP